MDDTRERQRGMQARPFIVQRCNLIGLPPEEAGHGHVMYGIIAFQSEHGCMGKAVLFSAQFH